MIVLVTGGRAYADRVRLFAVLDQWAPTLVLHGRCPRGADDMAREWTQVRGVHEAGVRALWRKHGKAAGPKRNAVLVEMCRRLGGTVLAFPGGSGTADCVRRARALGLPVVEVAP